MKYALPIIFASFTSSFALAAPPPVETFAARAALSDIALSPNGKFVALAVPSSDGSETQLHIAPLEGEGGVQALRFGRRMHVDDVIWTSNDRVVVSRAVMEPLKAQPESRGELFSSNITGTEQKFLFGYTPGDGIKLGRRTDKGFAWISQTVDGFAGDALVSYRCWDCGENPATELYRVNTASGDRKLVERLPGYNTFLADLTGTARVAVSLDDEDVPLIKYRPKHQDDWQILPKEIAGYLLTPLRFASDNNQLYALISDKGEPRQLYQVDLSTGKRTLLIGRSNLEISQVLYKGRHGAPFAVIYDAGKPAIDYVDKSSEWTALHAGLMDAFSGQMVRFIQFSTDDNVVLFSAYSDRQPSTYYTFDRSAKKLRQVSTIFPSIKAEQMAPTRAIEYKTRDGEVIYGFYTAQGTESRPLVVIPHGGPYDIYDTWEYDQEVQFLASRGYGVLRVNFRGSGGRGQKFVESGHGEWAKKIQDDIADGVKWATSTKLTTADRICIYGASFGGYSALMNPIRHPDLYKCAIGYVGVYDLELMHKVGDIRSTERGRRYLERVVGTDPAVLAQGSPAKLADQIKLPVFLAHGAADKRVPIHHFNAMVKAFEKQGIAVETLVIDDEAHGFIKPESRVKLLSSIEAFLDKHIGHPKK